MAKVSIQILPKDKEYMSCLVARPGHKLLHLDFNSLEPTVMTELSRDPLYMEIYASGKPHRIYLFFAVHNDPLGAEIAKVYNLDNPTKESVAAAKKMFSSQDTKWKVQVLMSSYLAGAEKKRRKAMLDGIWMSKEEAKDAHNSYKESLAGLDKWRDELKKEWERNGGWIYNATGRPVSCTHMDVKDLGSRCVQSGGHDITVEYVYNICKIKKERQVIMYPYNSDLHDATIFEVPDRYVEQGVAVMEDALVELNEHLGGMLPIKGDVDVGTSMADFKEWD